jgi:hypothetical protein
MIHSIGIDPILRAAEGQDVKGAIGVGRRGFNHDCVLLDWRSAAGYRLSALALSQRTTHLANIANIAKFAKFAKFD